MLDLGRARAGKEASVFVDPAAYASSVHGAFGCIDCHTDLDGVELTHATRHDPDKYPYLFYAFWFMTTSPWTR